MGMTKLVRWWMIVVAMCLSALIGHAQQPQTSDIPPTQPIFSVNAKYTQGTGPGYWPTAGSGLTLNLTAGTAVCTGTIITYAGGTLTMTNSTTNYVYLNQASSCAPATSTSSSVFSTNFPIAVVIASGGVITSIQDVRTMFSQAPASGSGTVQNCSAQYSLAEYLVSGTAVGCGPVPPSVQGDYLCGYYPTTAAAVAPACPQLGLPSRSVTGTTDTILYSDVGINVVYSGTAAVAVTLPTPTSLNNTAFWLVIDNFTGGPGGVVTVTPTTLTISKENGSTASTLAVAVNQECRIAIDPAHTTTNWLSHCTAVSSSGTVTSIATTSPISGGTITTSGTISCPTCVTSASALTSGQLMTGAGSQASQVSDLSGDVTTSGSTATTLASKFKIRSFGTTFGDTGGSALSSGSVVYFTIPYACTIAAWNISVDAGTVTFDIWKIATGTAIPTVTNTITASAKPALSTGTSVHSTTLTGWTTSVSANDIFGIQLNTVATAKYAEIDIQCNQ